MRFSTIPGDLIIALESSYYQQMQVDVLRPLMDMLTIGLLEAFHYVWIDRGILKVLISSDLLSA